VTRRNWTPIIHRGREIADHYNRLMIGITLRSLFYRLVAEQLIRNALADYKTLSKLTDASREPDVEQRQGS
jgi:hypothetical protein